MRFLYTVLVLVACSEEGEKETGTNSGSDGSTEDLMDTDATGPTGTLPEICINELQPDNDATLEVDGQFPDWVELHNATVAEVTLNGWFLSESRDGGTSLDGLSIPANGYLVLTADEVWGGADLPFNLDSDGQDLQLIDPRGGGARIEWSHIRGDNSAMRQTECCLGDCWVISGTPTPGATNSP